MACHVPVCPGNGDCFGRGFCNGEYMTPRCENCDPGWMGPDCNTGCVNGVQVCSGVTGCINGVQVCSGVTGCVNGVQVCSGVTVKLPKILDTCYWLVLSGFL